jgi:glycerol-3-phosphate acyltransferase PlsY
VGSQFIAGVLGYLIGSIPIAFLFVKWKSNIDIRTAGSGNVGTLNSFEVTRSKGVGAGVLLLDLLKGATAVWVGGLVGDGGFPAIAVAAVTVVVGHNFPVWLKFHGGRGLAPAAGAMLTISWVLVLFWGIGWATGFNIARRVNIGNIVANLLLLTIIWVLPDSFLGSILQVEAPITGFRVFASIFLAVILIRHVDPLKEYIRERALRNQ